MMTDILALQSIEEGEGGEEEAGFLPTITITTTVIFWSTLSNGCSGFSIGCKA